MNIHTFFSDERLGMNYKIVFVSKLPNIIVECMNLLCDIILLFVKDNSHNVIGRMRAIFSKVTGFINKDTEIIH